MDDDAPQRRRTPLALVLSLVSGIVVLAAGVVGGLLWLISRQDPPPVPHESNPPPPVGGADGGGGGTGAADTPGPNEAETAAGAEGDGTGVDADGCDEDVSCDGPSCETQSCEAPACESGTNVASAGVSVMAVLPLVAVGRLTPRRPTRRRARVSVPARCGLVAIRGYRRYVSPRTSTRCRYVPSCSGYGASTIARYGLASGSRLALRRIRRCTRSVPMGTVDAPP